MKPNTIQSEEKFAKPSSATLEGLNNILKQASPKKLKMMYGNGIHALNQGENQ
jgi:hypothetical protein